MGGGALLAAALGNAFGVRVALVAVGLIGPVLVVVSWTRLRRLDLQMVDREDDIALLRSVSVFDPLPLPALEQLAAGLESLDVAAGTPVFEQGDAGDGCYVIESGTAEVVGDGSRIATLGPGDLVGEIALLREVPRTATVRALTDLRLRRLEGEPVRPGGDRLGDHEHPHDRPRGRAAGPLLTRAAPARVTPPE